MKRYPKPQNLLMPSTANKDFKTVETSQVSVVPERHLVLEDALQVLWVEIARIRRKQSTGKELEPKDITTMSRLMDGISKISKEQRESDKEFNPKDVTDEEALAELEAASAVIRKRIANKAMEGNEDEK